MKDDPDLEMDDDWSDDSISSRIRGRMRSGKSKLFRISLAMILVSIFAGGILYFLTKRPTASEGSLLQSKLIALEQKIAGLETQVGELQGKVGPSSPDPALLQRMEALAQKVEALEKQKRPAVESKATPALPSKPPASAEKQYHKVRKGETLSRISKQYGISMEELRKLNHLSQDQPPRPGQKLLVSRH